MTPSLLELVGRFPALCVLVVGDAMLDSYLEGPATRLCPEAPVPVVDLDDRVELPGGAANAALNAATLGARTRLLTVLGDDEEALILLRQLGEAGVDDGLAVRTPTRATVAKRRVLSAGQLLVRVDTGTKAPLTASLENELVGRLERAWRAADAVVLSDYCHGVVTGRVRAAVGQLQERDRKALVVDAKDLTAYRCLDVTAVKPNYAEVAALLRARELEGEAARSLWVASNAERILERTGARMAAVTLDSDGALVLERGRAVHRTYARPAADSRAIGAGDTFTAALALALAAGADAPGTAELAQAAASIVVGKERTAACTRTELEEHLAGRSRRVVSRHDLDAILARERGRGARVVFTNGCFDILHRGHITYLNQAKALGDLLVVGVNADESVRRLKGAGRPINPLEDRAELLAALSCVDYVVPFDEETPVELIRAVQPDVFVKGGDYTRDTLPEARVVDELGGAVHLLPFVRDRSTTSVIEQIRSAPRRAVRDVAAPSP